MRKPSSTPSLDIDLADRRVNAPVNGLLAATQIWLDSLEPFVIEWELIWPM